MFHRSAPLPEVDDSSPSSPGNQETGALANVALDRALSDTRAVHDGVAAPPGDRFRRAAVAGPDTRYLFIAFAAWPLGWLWLSHRGLFRAAARRGGWRLACAVVASLGILIFVIDISMGQVTIAIAAWLSAGSFA